jgi:hypothetical protein
MSYSLRQAAMIAAAAALASVGASEVRIDPISEDFERARVASKAKARNPSPSRTPVPAPRPLPEYKPQSESLKRMLRKARR